MEAETQNTSSELDTESLPSNEVASSASSDSLPSADGKSFKKKGKKKKDAGSDVAFFICFPSILIAVVIAITTGLGFLPNSLIGEFCASLRAQFVIILLLCILPPLFTRRFVVPMVVGCLLVAVCNLAFVAPCMVPKTLTKDQEQLSFVNFRLLQLSIEDSQTKIESVIETVNKSKADVVCVTGCPQSSLLKLNELMPPQYLHRAFFIRDDGYAQACYSTDELKGTKQRKVGPEKLPVICTSIHFDYGWFRLIMVKLPEPTNEESLTIRNEQLTAVAEVVKSLDGRKIVLGNFNMTPYSMAFGSFLKDTELSDTRIGVQPNWNLGPIDFLGLLHLPVDHIFVNKSVAVLHRYVMPTEGLTHQPLLAELYPADREAVTYKEEPDESEEPVSKPAATTQPSDQAASVDEKKSGKRKKRGK